MIVVRKPDSILFNYAEIEELFEECKKDIGTDETLRQVIKNSDFYAFYDWHKKELIGCIYYYMLGKRRLVNAFARRGHHELNIDCFKQSLRWYTGDIYAKALHRTSKMCIYKCGFRKLKGNLYKYNTGDKKWVEKQSQQA